MCQTWVEMKTLFRCIFQSPYCVWSAVVQNFHSYALCQCTITWHIYATHMSPAPNGSSAIQHFEHSNTIWNGIKFNFCLGLPYMGNQNMQRSTHQKLNLFPNFDYHFKQLHINVPTFNKVYFTISSHTVLTSPPLEISFKNIHGPPVTLLYTATVAPNTCL